MKRLSLKEGESAGSQKSDSISQGASASTERSVLSAESGGIAAQAELGRKAPGFVKSNIPWLQTGGYQMGDVRLANRVDYPSRFAKQSIQSPTGYSPGWVQ